MLLSKVTAQAMNYAIRSGITITSGYAIQQAAKLLRNVPADSSRQELFLLQRKLESKIRIIAPAIDMIELIAARGNTSLESAVSLTKELRREIQKLGQRLSRAAVAEEDFRRKKGRIREAHEAELKLILADMRGLLSRIEEAVPMINLAITTSGAKLSTTLPATVSPSRLLQASTFLTSGDSMYVMGGGQKAQIGTGFSLSLYMLFQGHADRIKGDEDEFTALSWKEVIHKARVKLQRVPLENWTPQSNLSPGSSDAQKPHKFDDQIRAGTHADEYAYQLSIIEDLDDGRFHTTEDGESEEQHGCYEDVPMAGIREIIPVHQISKIFYADTGKILNLGRGDDDTLTPVLLFKRDVTAVPPRREIGQEAQDDSWNYERDEDADNGTLSHQTSVGVGLSGDTAEPTSESEVHDGTGATRHRFSSSLDPEWLAFEVFEDEDEEEEVDDQTSEEEPVKHTDHSPRSSDLKQSMGKLYLHSDSPAGSLAKTTNSTPPVTTAAIKSSLSLLEMLVRLTALQQFQQRSHLSISDELLNFFLEESSSTGAGADVDERRRKRNEARQRLGFDPYDESPVQRRRIREEMNNDERYDDLDLGSSHDHGTPFTPGNAGPHWSRSDSNGKVTPRSQRSSRTDPGYPSPGSSPPTMGRSQYGRGHSGGWNERFRKEYPQSPLRSSQAVGHDSGLGVSSPDSLPSADQGHIEGRSL